MVLPRNPLFCDFQCGGGGGSGPPVPSLDPCPDRIKIISWCYIKKYENALDLYVVSQTFAFIYPFKRNRNSHFYQLDHSISILELFDGIFI